MATKKQRESGIELLKIFAMFLIVLAHVNQTLYSDNEFFSSEYIIRQGIATKNISQLLMNIFSYSGAQGNFIFFVCSAYFLLDSKEVNIKKVIYMISDVWIINIIFLIIFSVGNWFDLPLETIIKCLFPNTFNLNWYITCYILFYLIHTSLNKIINDMSQKKLLTATLVMLILYFGIDFIHNGHFFSSSIIYFITIYFTMAYIKKYVVLNNNKKNTLLLLLSISGMPVMIIITNFLGLHIKLFQDKLTNWGYNNSPFLLLTAILLFNIFRQIKFTNKTINNISSLTLIIYITHENILFRRYVRPLFWIYIYNNFDYSYFLIYDFIQALILFLLALLVAFIYKISLQKLVYKACNKLYEISSKAFDNTITRLMTIK